MEMEAAKGDLFRYAAEKEIKIQEVLLIVQQVLCALEYLHGQNISHNDLKLENVLKFPDSVWKLGGFKYSQQVSNYTGSESQRSAWLSRQKQILAPEFADLLFEKVNLESKDLILDEQKSDMYMIGILLFELIFQI